MNILASATQVGNFWDFSAWGFINIIAVLLVSLLLANLLKKKVGFLKKSLIPTSVLGGIILLIISFTYSMIAGKNPSGEYQNIFDLEFFNGNGLKTLYLIAYHALAIGFIASTMQTHKRGETAKERTRDIFNTGVQTVSTYLLQGVLGLGITIVFSLTILPELFPASGVILPFGYGQGTGQALNWGTIYQNDYGFSGGANFGLTIAAFGFLSASIGGVIALNLMGKKGKHYVTEEDSDNAEVITEENQINLNHGVDKLSVQFAFVLGAYMLANVLMWGLSKILPSMKETIYGFNFLFGVLFAVLIKFVLKKLKKANLVKKDYVSNYLMARITGFSFDLMIVAGFAAIEIQLLAQYWYLLLILGVVGATSTYFYTKFVSKKLFPSYCDQQFMGMFGMLTGTASTGMMLLHEVDSEYKTPVADNLVYQNFPAIVFGFPLMMLAKLAPENPYLTLGILFAMLIALNIILFRNQIFKKRKNKNTDKNA